MISAATQVNSPEAVGVLAAFILLAALVSWLASWTLPRLYPDVRLAELDTDDHDLSLIVGNCDCGACTEWTAETIWSLPTYAKEQQR